MQLSIRTKQNKYTIKIVDKEDHTICCDDTLSVRITKTADLTYQQLSITLLPSQPLCLQDLILEDQIENHQKVKSVLLNGYQSWTDTREFMPFEKLSGQHILLKPILNGHFKLKYGSDYLFYKYKNKKGILHSHSWAFTRRIDESIDFIGSLSENTGFTIIEYDFSKAIVQLIKDCKNRIIDTPYICFNILFTSGKEEECYSKYFKIMGIEKRDTSEPVFGWTSWYKYFTAINEDIINKCLNSYSESKTPLTYFQIDDGYQNHIGDWKISNNKFPSGMKNIAAQIHAKGYKAGIWVAPFICEKSSDLYKNHYDWILKENGKPVPAGRNPNWDGDYYALDFYNLNFRTYLKDVVNTILSDWGFDLVKLDFLFAVCILPRRNKTRGEIMFEAMSFLRELVGEKKILACGVPIAAAFKNCDYCRIGPDTGLSWENFKAKLLNHRERISTVNCLQNTIYRRHLDGYGFLNDPDVFILRENNNSLSKNERETLFFINFILGSVIFTSDTPDELSEEMLELYNWQFTVRSKVIYTIDFSDNILKIVFGNDNKRFLLVVNLQDKNHIYQTHQNYKLCFKIEPTNTNSLILPAHGSILLEYQS